MPQTNDSGMMITRGTGQQLSGRQSYSLSYFNFENDLTRLRELREALQNFDNLILRITNNKDLPNEVSEQKTIDES